MNDKERSKNLLDAINYAVDVADDGIDWLRAWRQGDVDAVAELERYKVNETL